MVRQESTIHRSTYKGVNPRYLSVDIPAETVLSVVTDLLIRFGEQWEHAHPTYDELYPDETPGE